MSVERETALEYQFSLKLLEYPWLYFEADGILPVILIIKVVPRGLNHVASLLPLLALGCLHCNSYIVVIPLSYVVTCYSLSIIKLVLMLLLVKFSFMSNFP